MLNLTLNEDQKLAIKALLSFLKTQDKFFILQGCAGTGKSTIITYLLEHSNFRKKKIAMTATTNKAVSVLESFMIKDKNLVFLTIHKLLKMKRKIDVNGIEQYVSNLENDNWELNKNNSIYDFDIIIIDEASMITKEITQKLTYLSKNIKGKIIFIGDKYQLPPVNETSSNVFNLKIPGSELKIVMRSKGNLTAFCDEIRKVVINPKYKINIKQYLSDDLRKFKNYNQWIEHYLEKYKLGLNPIMLSYTNNRCLENNQSIRSKLFINHKDRYVENELIVFNKFYQSSHKKKFYTSQQSKIKRILVEGISIKNLNFNSILNLKINLKKAENLEPMIREVNGVEINCPICYEDVVDFTIETKCKHYFCAGCIKLWLEKNNDCPYCRVSLKQTTGEICVKEDPELTNLLIDLKEKTSSIRYKCYNIELFDSTFSDPNFITVIHEDSIEQYKNDILFIINSLKNIKTHVDKKKYVNNFIKIFLNRLWEFYYTNFYDIFAEISYGYCITVHKSQGSTFKDVFVDFKNILNVNYEFKDKYKCLYTAISRSAESLSILL